MPQYSHSRLTTYQTCPLKYKYQYITKPDIEKRTNIEGYLGTCVHEAIQKIYLDKECGKHDALEEILTFYASEWDKHLPQNIHIVQRGLTLENYKAVGVQCITDYYKRHHPFNDGKTLGIELRVDVDLDGTGKYKLMGYIDRLVKIHDYKTNKTTPTQEEKDSDRQLAIYQLDLEKRWEDVRDVTLVWHFLRSDTMIRSKRTPEQLDELKQTLIKQIDEIEDAVKKDNLPPRRSHLCDWCDYQAICPLWKHELAVSVLSANEYLSDDGVQLVNAYAKLKTKKKELRREIEQIDEEEAKVEETIIAYAEREGVQQIVGSEKEVVIKVERTEKIPTKADEPEKQEALEQLLRPSPYWQEVSKLSASNLISLIEEGKMEPNWLQKIRQYVTTVVARKISLRKRKDLGEER
jgi:putative RecB family exonuclease